VVVIPSDEDEDSVDGPVFKRRRTTAVATSHSSSDRCPASLRDNPPSASPPPQYLALEEGAESVPEPTPAPAPELPRVIQHILRGYQQETTGNFTDEALPESIALSLGGFLTRANSSFHQAEVKAKEKQALADELVLVKEQMAKQAQRFFIQEAALTEEMGVLRKAELEANKRLHDEGQKYTTLLAKVVPLRAEIAELKDVVAATQAKMTNLEEHSVTREVHLGKVEAELVEKTEALAKAKEELAAQIEALENIKVELVEQDKSFEETKQELSRKTEVLVQAEKEMAVQAEGFQKVETELIDDTADAYAVGFEDALAQVVCKHPEMDTSPFSTVNHVVEGEIVPRSLPHHDVA